MNPHLVSAETGIDFEVTQLVFEIEERHGHEVHMVIEPIIKDYESEVGPNWWVEFKDTQKVFSTLEEVRTFFLEECEA